MPQIQPEQLDLTRGHRMATAGRGQKQSQQIQMATYEMQRQAHLKSVLEKDFDNYIKFGTFENRVQFAQHIGSKGAVELAGFLRNMSQEDWKKWHAKKPEEVHRERTANPTWVKMKRDLDIDVDRTIICYYDENHDGYGDSNPRTK